MRLVKKRAQEEEELPFPAARPLGICTETSANSPHLSDDVSDIAIAFDESLTLCCIMHYSLLHVLTPYVHPILLVEPPTQHTTRLQPSMNTIIVAEARPPLDHSKWEIVWEIIHATYGCHGEMTTIASTRHSICCKRTVHYTIPWEMHTEMQAYTQEVQRTVSRDLFNPNGVRLQHIVSVLHG